MEYGLRLYEAIQRLWWLVFLVLCLVAANYSHSFTQTPRAPAQLKDLRNLDFWTGLYGIRMSPPAFDTSKEKLDQAGQGAKREVGKPGVQDKKPPVVPPPAISEDTQKDVQLLSRVLIFLIRAALIFLQLKLLWLIIQFCGKYLLQFMISGSMSASGVVRPEIARTHPEAIFPRQTLLDRINKVPLNFLLHPFLRLRLMLSGSQKNISSEELFEKERRIVETDWQILYSSWGPFRWLSWILPMLGLALTAWFLVLQFHSASLSQKDILDMIQSMPNSLLPLAQAAGVALFLKIVSSLIRRLEELYLSNLDAFVYDKLLSKLPLQSSDTVLILETLRSQFNDMQSSLKRLEKLIQPEQAPTPERRSVKRVEKP